MVPPPSFDIHDRPLCDYCEEVLGTYEPIVLAEGGGGMPRRTSRAAEPLAADARAWHEDCYVRAADAREQRRGLHESSLALRPGSDHVAELAKEIEDGLGG